MSFVLTTGRGTSGRPRWRRTATAAAVVVLTTVLAGCGAADDEPAGTAGPAAASGSASPADASAAADTSDTAEQAEAQAVEDAEAGYATYREAADDALIAGGGSEQFEALQPLLGSGDMITWWRSITDQFADSGMTQAGHNHAVSVEAGDVTGDPSTAKVLTVALTVCLDGTDVDLLLKNGKSAVTDSSADGPVLADVVMERQADGRWTVVEDTTRQPFEPC